MCHHEHDGLENLNQITTRVQILCLRLWCCSVVMWHYEQPPTDQSKCQQEYLFLYLSANNLHVVFKIFPPFSSAFSIYSIFTQEAVRTHQNYSANKYIISNLIFPPFSSETNLMENLVDNDKIFFTNKENCTQKRNFNWRYCKETLLRIATFQNCAF